MRFTLDGAPMLTDFTSPYVFTLDSRRWGDGQYTMGVTALMRDGFVSGVVAKGLAFANGQKKAPPNKLHFTPTSGSPPAPGAPLVVAAVGDGGGGEPGDAANVGLISSWNPNLFLYLGDVYQDGPGDGVRQLVRGERNSKPLRQIEVAHEPTIGNHEYVGTDAFSRVEIGALARGTQGGGLMSVGLTGTGTQQSLASRESATPPQLVLTIGGFSALGPDAASVAVLRPSRHASRV